MAKSNVQQHTASLTIIICLSFLSLTHYSSSSSSSSSSTPDLHDLLLQYNLPKGIIPSNVKSYTLSQTNNSFTVELSAHPCYVKFDGNVVYYDRIIKGKLEYGKVSGVSGIQAKKLFFWVSVNGIDVDEKNGMVQFHVGSLSEELPAKDFEVIKSCSAKGLRGSFSLMEAVI